MLTSTMLFGFNIIDRCRPKTINTWIPKCIYTRKSSYCSCWV